MKKIDRHEPAVVELKEDLLSCFSDQIIKKSRITPTSIDRLFDVVQEEFDKGEQPSPYVCFKEGRVDLIIRTLNKKGSYSDVRGELFCIVEAYGKAHAEVLAGIETKDIGFVTDESYKSIKVTQDQINQKIADMKKEISIWENII